MTRSKIQPMPKAESQTSDSFMGKLAKAWPAAQWADLHVLVAVSGGPDSVALLRGLHELKSQAQGRGRLHAAHFNHGWRGEESDQDAQWVTSLCAQLGIPLYSGSATQEHPTAAASEDSARQVRYQFLMATSEQLGARYVCTAHTQNDQVETVLHRIVRGTAVGGLAGIPKVRQLGEQVTLIRPLLEVTRHELVAYLESIDQSYRMDSSNEDISYARNRIRNELLPTLRKQFNPEVDDALLRLARHAAEIQDYLHETASDLLDQTVTIDLANDTIHLACGLLDEFPNLIAREVCKLAWRKMSWPEQAMGYTQWRELGELVHSPSPRTITLPGNVRAVREADVLSLIRSTK